MKHLINLLSFEINCPSENEALGLRHNYAQTLQMQMEAGIDKICSKYTDQEHTIRIAKLELDLGQFNVHTFDRYMIDVFLDRFERALLNELKEKPFSERIETNTYSQFEALIHFLETGQRIWWESHEQPDFDHWFLKYFKENQHLFLDFLKNNTSNDRIWKRIAFQFNSLTHKNLVNEITILKMATDWMVIRIAEFLNDEPEVSLNQLINKLVIANFPQLNNGDSISVRTLKLLASHIEKINNKKPVSRTMLTRQIETLLTKNWNEIQDDSLSVEFAKMKVEKRDQEKYLSSHGGAVLISQFLKPLFKNLGLYVDGEWKDSQSQFKAVLLINYMCTSEDSTAEYNLNIEKLLCGLPLNAPIPFEADLTKNEMQEATLLLESIIEHWGVLKNTSIDGLRQTFLLRECIISKNGTNWQINVERKTVDVLLDKLPWGYSLIMLPWNDHQIYVTW